MQEPDVNTSANSSHAPRLSKMGRFQLRRGLRDSKLRTISLVAGRAGVYGGVGTGHHGNISCF